MNLKHNQRTPKGEYKNLFQQAPGWRVTLLPRGLLSFALRRYIVLSQAKDKCMILHNSNFIYYFSWLIYYLESHTHSQVCSSQWYGLPIALYVQTLVLVRYNFSTFSSLKL